MRLPAIKGLIKRRLLVNFRVDPDVIGQLLPAGLSPKLQGDHAIAGICLIRLEQVRPAIVPWAIGYSSENAAHRIAVAWRDQDGSKREGVYIPIRHTDSAMIQLLGGRLFPGVHRRAVFDIKDDGQAIDLSARAVAGDMDVELRARPAGQLAAGSAFPSIAAASEFFRGGSIGYSPGRSGRLEGLRLVAPLWRVAPLAVSAVTSSWLSDPSRFPRGTVEFDCALVMRDINHRWEVASDLFTDPEAIATRTARSHV